MEDGGEAEEKNEKEDEDVDEDEDDGIMGDNSEGILKECKLESVADG